MTDPAASSGPSHSPLLSVVVAAAGADAFVNRCVEAVRASTGSIPTELLVVGARRAEPDGSYQPITAPPDTLVPVLWQAGLDAARGTFVAFLTAHAIVDRTWADAMMAALATPGVAGAGGPFRLAPDAAPEVSAVFFLRFSKHLEERWHPGAYDGEIAADNAMYRRADLLESGPEPGGGFWEVESHRRLRASGRTFQAADGAAVTIVGAPPAVRMLRERFRHGRRYGAWRSRMEVSRARVVVAAPAVPFVLTARIVKRVWASSGYRRRLIASMPWLMAFATAWAAGEAVGAMETQN